MSKVMKDCVSTNERMGKKNNKKMSKIVTDLLINFFVFILFICAFLFVISEPI